MRRLTCKPLNRVACRRADAHAAQPARAPLRATLLAMALAQTPAGLALLAMPLAGTALAADAPQERQTRRNYAIPPGTLQSALTRFGLESGVMLSYTAADIEGRRSPGLQGSHDAADALAALLYGTGLRAVPLGQGFAIQPDRTGTPGAQTMLPAVTVSAGRAGAEEARPAYAGGQIARGARLGLLGNTDTMDSPYNSMAYTAQTIEDQQARTVADVLANDPAVRFTTSSGHLYENYTVRGFLVNSGDLALNGMYGLTPEGHVPTEMIERVEVLRGPGALLTGMSPNGSIGGVINLVPKRAQEEPLTRLSTTYQSEGHIGAHVDIGRRFGDDRAFGVRFNGADGNGRTGIDGQSKQRELGALALDYAGSRVRLSLDAYANREEARNGSPWMASFTGPTVPEPPATGTNILRGSRGRLENEGVAARGEVDLNDNWTAYAGLGMRNYRYYGFINGTRANNVQPNGNFTLITYNQKGYIESVSGEAGVRGTVRTGPVEHRLVLSGTVLDMESGTINNASRAQISNIYRPITPVLAAEPGAAPRTAESRLTSLAVADTLAFADDSVLLTLGARHQRVRSDSYSATTGVRTASYDESAVTPTVGLVLKPWGKGLSLYGNYIEGLSQGDTVTDASAANYGQVFAPYKTKQIEAGIKWDTGRLSHTLAAYQIERPSMMRDAASNTYNADAERRHRGLEWTVYGEPVTGTRVLGGLAYTRAVLTRTANGSYDGNTAVGTPAWSANLGAEQDLRWVPGLTLSGRVTYTSSQFVNSSNTQRIDAWTRVDIGARYITRLAGKRVGFYANIENLFDKSYWAGSFNEGYVTQNAPRIFKLTATVDF